MTLQINTPTGQRALTTDEQAEVREGIGAQSAAQASAAASAAVATHTGATDPHPGKYAALDHTHAGLMTTVQATKLDALPEPTALDAAIASKADATHTHTLLMTQPERDKLADLPTAAALTTAQAAQDTAIGERMLNTADAIADVLETAPVGDLARIQSSVSGELKLSSTDAAANTAVALAAGGGIVPVGVWPFAPIAATTSLYLTGHGSASVLSFAATAGVAVQGTAALELSNLTLRGPVAGTKAAVAAASGLAAVVLDCRLGQRADRCWVSDFGGVGIGLIGDTSANDVGAAVLGCEVTSCFAGIDSGYGGSTGEYCKIIGNTLNLNRIGYKCGSGNNIFVGNSVQYNGYGIEIDGLVTNDGHGSIVGNSVNHSTVMSLYVHDVQYGHEITGNNFFSAGIPITIAESNVDFTNNTVLCGTFATSGLAQAPRIHGNRFPTTAPTIVRTGVTAARGVWYNNRLQNGWDIDGAPYAVSSVTVPAGANLATNGTFDADTSWTKGAGWTIAGGVLQKAAGAVSNTYQAMGMAASTQYQLDMTVVTTAGAFNVGAGGAQNSFSNRTDNGAVSFLLSTGAGTDGRLYITSNAAFVGSFDNIVVRAVASAEILTVGTTQLTAGAFTPEGAVAAAVGSEHTNTAGTAGTPTVPGNLKYVKTSGTGTTGWVAVL